MAAYNFTQGQNGSFTLSNDPLDTVRVNNGVQNLTLFTEFDTGGSGVNEITVDGAPNFLKIIGFQSSREVVMKLNDPGLGRTEMDLTGGHDTVYARVADGYMTKTDGYVEGVLHGTAGHTFEAFLGSGGSNMTYFGGNFTVVGGSGSDRIDVHSSASSLVFGGLGNDNITANVSAGQKITIMGGRGINDTADGADTIAVTGNGQSEVYGNGGDDRIQLSDGGGYASGGVGNDVIAGGKGNDVINGGPGHNQLVGGAGNDYFVNEARGDAKALDQILDFSKGQDVLSVTLTQDSWVRTWYDDVNKDGIQDTVVAIGRVGQSDWDYAGVLQNQTMGKLYVGENGAYVADAHPSMNLVGQAGDVFDFYGAA